SRFPGKPLVEIAGKPMLAHVWARTRQAERVDVTIVATDDERIAACCEELGMDYQLTSPKHPTGTDRLAEVAPSHSADIYVNVQGDEPLIEPAAIDAVVAVLQQRLTDGIEVATAYIEGATPEQEQNDSVVHLVPTADGCVLALSRLPIPKAFKDDYVRNVHVGLYAFTPGALVRYAERAQGPVERAESIEMLRFLEYSERIACVAVPAGSIGVDYPRDVARVEARLTQAKN
ncbi:MAG: 3-deoxy-manno-octulosonate cytidylyltransferase, partial [Gammaproteobacteria bacterium]|nr:3-deoxy-manno-octulosonate cytidylyltransferase [Gammaproteobacteria bacterium]